jgi:hypothetical protein
VDADHANVPNHSGIFWWILGKVLKKLWDLQKEILMILGFKNKD